MRDRGPARAPRVRAARRCSARDSPSRPSVAKQDVHHRAGERSIRARPHAQGEIGLAHRFGFIDVDSDDFRAAFLARANRMGHDVDLRGDRVRAPDDDAIRLRHFARISAHQPAGSGDIAGPCDADADCPVEAGIALGVREALDSVAHHETHRAGVEVGPHAFGSELALDRQEIVGDAVERLVPADRRKLPASLGTDAAKRLSQPIRDDGSAPNSERPWRRRRRTCRSGRARRGCGRCAFRRSPRRRERKPRGSRADRLKGAA